MSYEFANPKGPLCWTATLGPLPVLPIDPKTGEEDFSTHVPVEKAMQDWRPGMSWEPQEIYLHTQELTETGKIVPLAPSDWVGSSVGGPIISERAVDALSDLMDGTGHLLEMKTVNSDRRFFFWWVPLIHNCVDMERSVFMGSTNVIKRYRFIEEKVDGALAFRAHYDGMYAPYKQSRVFLNESFKQAWEAADLKGVRFANRC